MSFELTIIMSLKIEDDGRRRKRKIQRRSVQFI